MSDAQSVSLDRVRDYWDSRPCNIRHSALSVGSREYFDEVEARKYRVEPHIPVFAQFERWANARVLELGCGLGTDTIQFARAGAEVTAIDYSAASLELAELRSVVFGLDDKITCIQANVEENLERVGSMFDLVYSFGVVHHSPHPDRILAEAHKVMRPGATLKIMVYHRRSWKMLWVLLRYGFGRFWKLSELIARHSEAQTGCPVTYVYSRQQARDLVESAGFQVTAIDVDHIFPYRIRDYVTYSYTKTLYWRVMPPRLFRFLERRFGWHLMVTAIKP